MLRPTVALLVFVLLASGAEAQKRVALVIGNSAYQHAPELINPKNDATDVAAALRTLGFQVIDGFDLNKTDFERKVRDFSAALRDAEAGVFFYAGHGLQVAGQNHLVPIEAKAETADALDWEMVPLDLVHRTMERATNTNIIFLDACRNNPFARNLARAMGTRSSEIGRGLAAVQSGVGTLISFSTQPGNVALDGKGRNSPFAGALVKRIAASSDDLSALLIDVRNDVRKETQNQQVPWEHSALTGRFYFNPAAKAASPAPSVDNSEIAALKKQLAQLEGELKLRQQSGVSTTLEMTAAKDELAKREGELKQREEELKKQQIAAATPPPPPPRTDLPKPAVAVTPKPPASSAPSPSLNRCDGIEALVGNERRCLKPKDSFKECPGCPEMVVVPTGEFVMGSPHNEDGRDDDEGPQHNVRLAKPVAVGRFAVTFEEWDACVAAGGCSGYLPSDQGWGRGRRPVINVSWNDAKTYIAWLSKVTLKSYRLLSEAEREYVSRAATTTPYWQGSLSNLQANFNRTNGVHPRATMPVDSFIANPWGFFNVHGNVWEWTEDCWNASYEGAPSDGTPRTTGDCTRRVIRGGSWNVSPRYLRSAIRAANVVEDLFSGLGFRVARSLEH